MPMVKDLPLPPEPAVAAIPIVLRERDQWVVWRYEKRAGQRTKIPYDPRTGGNASAADPGTWTAFDVAWKTFQQTRRYDGLAYVFRENVPFCGFDLDDCLDEDGQLLWGADLLEQLDSYCEISPSGRGLKLIVHGKKPAYARCKAAWNGGGTIEIYDQRRLFAITGQRFAETNPEIADRQTVLDALCRQLWGHLPSPAQPHETVGGSSGEMSRSELSDRQQRCLAAMQRMQLVCSADSGAETFQSGGSPAFGCVPYAGPADSTTARSGWKLSSRSPGNCVRDLVTGGSRCFHLVSSVEVVGMTRVAGVFGGGNRLCAHTPQTPREARVLQHSRSLTDPSA
jgi:hypothetical protein